MYLKRKIDDYLLAWQQDGDRKPLIIKGARQIGKTESIRHFALGRYENMIEINFALEPKYKTITADGYDVASVVKNITLLDPSKEFVPGKTLILFDELQEFPDIATSLKAFCADRRYDVICSGSLLGIHYKKIHSNSVGYKTDYEMRSMDFEEFLWSRGYDNAAVENMLDHMRQLKPFSENEMSVYEKLFMDFCILGGMPAVVRLFAEKGNFSGTLDLQKQLLLDYENFTAEALVKQGYALYYYKREDSQLEEDFFVRTQQELLPLEVKANQNRSKSLSALIKNERYTDVSHGLKLTKGNIGESGGIYTFPYFCAFLIKRYLETWLLS